MLLACLFFACPASRRDDAVAFMKSSLLINRPSSKVLNRRYQSSCLFYENGEVHLGKVGTFLPQPVSKCDSQNEKDTTIGRTMVASSCALQQPSHDILARIIDLVHVQTTGRDRIIVLELRVVRADEPIARKNLAVHEFPSRVADATKASTYSISVFYLLTFSCSLYNSI